MMSKCAPGTCPADPGKPSFAHLPYEIQSAIFEAAAQPQVIIVNIVDNVMTFSRPGAKAMGLVCQLSREIYLKDRKLLKFGSRYHWIDPKRDIFYLRLEDPVPRTHRPANSQENVLPTGDEFDKKAVENVAVDLQYMGVNPRHDAIMRMWSIFPAMRQVHVFVPGGPFDRPARQPTPDNLLLRSIPNAQVIEGPGKYRELWLALRYQVRKVCGKILDADHGWLGRGLPEIFGHYTTVLEGPEDWIVDEMVDRLVDDFLDEFVEAFVGGEGEDEAV